MTAAAADFQPVTQPAIPVYDAVSLTRGGALAHIQLNDQVYALRITRAGKLILTK
ncbi:hemin uptake protein HemP [Gemmobacter sp.]|uniref:hemin uptake protein HemP n=1 Tax=Gemmobacter sp. TaxID=1898957 RepID=UPI002AFE1693|nr:hemin uptake protein HemP [Gemmobacter sp.]